MDTTSAFKISFKSKLNKEILFQSLARYTKRKGFGIIFFHFKTLH